MPKNFRKIPPHVENALKRLPSQPIVVGCALRCRAADIEKGSLSHLRISLKGDGLQFPSEIVPPSSQGKVSKRNRDGYEIVRRDLPLETHYNAVETPNWGDSYNGTHTVYLPYEAYPRDHYPPLLTPIRIHCAETAAGRAEYVLSFQVPVVLDRKVRKFREDLLTNLNLLQENVGASGVMVATESLDSYTRSLSVSWEILPPGTKEEAVARVFRGRTATPEQRRDVEDRYTFMQSLKPKQMVYGQTGFQRYFGALLSEDLVVFENIEYGNAIYIMFKEWQVLSQRSRVELLSGRLGKEFERVPHIADWKKRVRTIISERVKS